MSQNIDPSWWEVALEPMKDEHVAGTPEMLSFSFFDLARAADEGSLRRRVLEALAMASSAMLEPDDWNEPFTPLTSSENGRSFIPRDLSPDQLELLADLVVQISHPPLRARIADVTWCYGFRNRADLLALAVDSYYKAEPGPSEWQNSWNRAFQLARRSGPEEKNKIRAMAEILERYLTTCTIDDRFTVRDVSAMLRSMPSPGRDRAERCARHLSSLAVEATDSRLARHLEREAIAWWRKGNAQDHVNDGLTRVANRYVEEADQRLCSGEAGAMAASVFFEKAIATIRQVPRSVRASRGLDERISHLSDRLSECRVVSVELMTHIQSDPIDLTDSIDQSRQAVSGREKTEALVILCGLLPLTDIERSTAETRERMSNSLSHLFSRSTLTSDGRKIASSPGGLGGEQALLAELTRNFTMRLGVVVTGVILPAQETANFEHYYRLENFVEVCDQSPVIPVAHSGLWAEGLWRGMKGEWAAAASLLVPQVEQLVRLHLQKAGSETLFVDDRTGVQIEKGLKPLLDMPEAVPTLGKDLVFELQALLVEPGGPNLRNQIAHGLLTDAEAWSAAAVYAWWLALRLAVLPFWRTRPAQAPEPRQA